MKYLFPLLILVACQSKVNSPLDIADTNSLPQYSPYPNQDVISLKTFKGENWQLELTPEWKQKLSNEAELVLFTEDETSTALIQKIEYNSDLIGFANLLSDKLKAMGAEVKINEQFFVNSRNVIELETIQEGGIAWSWVSIYENHGYTLTCGGAITQYKKNRSLCYELLKKLYVGKMP